MRQNIFFRLFTLGLVVLILFAANCVRSTEQPHEEVIKRLARFLNSRMEGTQIEIDPAATIVKPVGNNRYQITLKNTSFTTDLTEFVDIVYKHIVSKDNPYAELDTTRLEEVILSFGPEEKYLDLCSIKGLGIENELKPKLTWPGGVELNKIRVSVGKITFQGHEASDSRSSESMEHLKVDLSGLTPKKDKISILLDIEKIGKVDTGKEDDNLSSYLLDPNARLPNLQIALETGAAVNDLNIRLGKVNVSIKKNDITLCNGILENASYLQFMKPEDTRKSFKFGYGVQLKNLKLSIPGKKAMELLSRVKNFHFEFSIKHLSEGASLAFLDLIKEIFSSRNLPDDKKMRKFTPLMMKLVIEIMQSKAHMQFVISPFKHYLGAMEASADIRLYNVMAGPIVTITATLFKVQNILNKLKEANIFSTATLETISGIIAKYGVKDKNGNVSFTYEMDIYQLNKMLLKGNQMLPPLSHNLSDFPKKQ